MVGFSPTIRAGAQRHRKLRVRRPISLPAICSRCPPLGRCPHETAQVAAAQVPDYLPDAGHAFSMPGAVLHAGRSSRCWAQFSMPGAVTTQWSPSARAAVPYRARSSLGVHPRTKPRGSGSCRARVNVAWRMDFEVAERGAPTSNRGRPVPGCLPSRAPPWTPARPKPRRKCY